MLLPRAGADLDLDEDRGGEGNPDERRLLSHQHSRQPRPDPQLEHRRAADRQLLGGQRNHHQVTQQDIIIRSLGKASSSGDLTRHRHQVT